MKLIKGKTYTFILKPQKWKDWKFIRETKNCYVMDKQRDRKSTYKYPVYIPKKNINKIIKCQEDKGDVKL